MKTPLDPELHLLWKSICIVPINSIPCIYKEFSADSLAFDHNGERYKLKLSKVVKRKNKIK